MPAMRLHTERPSTRRLLVTLGYSAPPTIARDTLLVAIALLALITLFSITTLLAVIVRALTCGGANVPHGPHGRITRRGLGITHNAQHAGCKPTATITSRGTVELEVGVLIHDISARRRRPSSVRGGLKLAN